MLAHDFSPFSQGFSVFFLLKCRISLYILEIALCDYIWCTSLFLSLNPGYWWIEKKNLKFNAIQFIILWWVFYFFVLCLNIFLFWNHEHILFIELNVLTCSSSRLVGPCVYVGMAPVSTVPVELYLVSYPQCGWCFSFRLWEGCHPPSAPRLLWWAMHVMNQVSVYALSYLEGFFLVLFDPPPASEPYA